MSDGSTDIGRQLNRISYLLQQERNHEQRLKRLETHMDMIDNDMIEVASEIADLWFKD